MSERKPSTPERKPSTPERKPSASDSSLIKIDLEVKPEPVESETIDHASVVSKRCMKCSKTASSICGFCIGCWRFCLNSCEACMECNIRCCTCAKSCLERIDCDDTP